MVQQTISRTHHRITIDLIGIDRLWWHKPFLHQRFTIKDPSQVEARCFPAALSDVIHESAGGRTIRDVRHAVREGLDVEAALNEVTA